MAEIDYDLLSQKVAEILKNNSQGVGEVPKVDSLEEVYSLPVNRKRPGATDEYEIAEAPMILLQQPALDAADVANTAAANADAKATLADNSANLATEKADLADTAAANTNKAIENAELATGSANAASASANQAAITANTAADNADEKAALADEAAANANDTAAHPTYIGADHYVYKWNKATKAYDKTDIYTKGDAFSIKKVYPSVIAMELDVNNLDISTGDFVLVNTDNVENPDNAKLYVKARREDGTPYYSFLVDMSGAIGFTGKTPQLLIGTIGTSEAGSQAQITISEDGTDTDGNPKYRLNFVIPRGNPGAPFQVKGQYATLEELQATIPDGSSVEGFIAVGDKMPFDYYAWVNGAWVNQGKIVGEGGGKMVLIPSAVLNLTNTSTSNEILDAFGGKEAFIEIVTKVKKGAPAAINADGASIILSMFYGEINDMDNSYILGFLCIDPSGGDENYSFYISFDGDVATIQKNVLPIGYANIIYIPFSVLFLLNTSSNNSIIEAFGGKNYLDSIVERMHAYKYICVIGDTSYYDSSFTPVTSSLQDYQDINNYSITLMAVDGSSNVIRRIELKATNGVYSVNTKIEKILSEYQLVSDPSVGGTDRPASAQAVKILNDTKVSGINIKSIVRLTQAEYDSLATKDDKTLYIII